MPFCVGDLKYRRALSLSILLKPGGTPNRVGMIADEELAVDEPEEELAVEELAEELAAEELPEKNCE